MGNERSTEQSVVFIVDDDDAFRTAVGRLVRSIGLNVVLLASAREFLAQKLPNAPLARSTSYAARNILLVTGL